MSECWIVPDWPAPSGVRSLITTRAGGTSEGTYSSMNVATHVGDDLNAVSDNRRWLRRCLPAEPVWLEQVHGTTVVPAEHASSGVVADGAFAFSRDVVCVVQTADCLPVLFCEEAAAVVGVAHAGWRGLAAGVLEALISAMQAEPARLMAFLGPAIGPQAFEVGDEVQAAFLTHSPFAGKAFMRKGSGKWLADLYMLARQRLAGLGVARVYGGGRCTFSEPEHFYSYRRDRDTGRMASLIWLER